MAADYIDERLSGTPGPRGPHGVGALLRAAPRQSGHEQTQRSHQQLYRTLPAPGLRGAGDRARPVRVLHAVRHSHAAAERRPLSLCGHGAVRVGRIRRAPAGRDPRRARRLRAAQHGASGESGIAPRAHRRLAHPACLAHRPRAGAAGVSALRLRCLPARDPASLSARPPWSVRIRLEGRAPDLLVQPVRVGAERRRAPVVRDGLDGHRRIHGRRQDPAFHHRQQLHHLPDGVCRRDRGGGHAGGDAPPDAGERRRAPRDLPQVVQDRVLLDADGGGDKCCRS